MTSSNKGKSAKKPRGKNAKNKTAAKAPRVSPIEKEAAGQGAHDPAAPSAPAENPSLLDLVAGIIAKAKGCEISQLKYLPEEVQAMADAAAANKARTAAAPAKERKCGKIRHDLVEIQVKVPGYTPKAIRQFDPSKTNAAKRARLFDDAIDELAEQMK